MSPPAAEGQDARSGGRAERDMTWSGVTARTEEARPAFLNIFGWWSRLRQEAGLFLDFPDGVGTLLLVFGLPEPTQCKKWCYPAHAWAFESRNVCMYLSLITGILHFKPLHTLTQESALEGEAEGTRPHRPNTKDAMGTAAPAAPTPHQRLHLRGHALPWTVDHQPPRHPSAELLQRDDPVPPPPSSFSSSFCLFASDLSCLSSWETRSLHSSVPRPF
ncbi:uncharacterized protein LOC108297739 [Cebus imitator]|uniref:uncharacterized protein LOC108297739 n=1 Tax=Cebus imitator TaxID=2715852 RepID=UPI001899C647|nr:uncharacterized protein LOC108297739 [Cebus imitator]